MLGPPWRFSPSTLRRIPLGYVPGPPNHVIELTREQREVLSELRSTRLTVLDGPSGSGKTHLAAAVALARAAQGQRVLVVAPRAPLAAWLGRALRPHGVEVRTVSACALAALARRQLQAQRLFFDDIAFFRAATTAVEGTRFDLVIVDEWQTTTELERDFLLRLAGRAPLLLVTDSSRSLQPEPPSYPSDASQVSLTVRQRSPGRVSLFDAALVQDAALPDVARSAPYVQVTVLDNPCALEAVTLDAIDAFLGRGFLASEVGVISCDTRAKSPLIHSMTSAEGPRALLLTHHLASSGVACDSFPYWFGLERRALVVVEPPPKQDAFRARLHIAVSRACDSVHIVALREHVEVEPSLRNWSDPSRAGSGSRNRRAHSLASPYVPTSPTS